MGSYNHPCQGVAVLAVDQPVCLFVMFCCHVYCLGSSPLFPSLCVYVFTSVIRPGRFAALNPATPVAHQASPAAADHHR